MCERYSWIEKNGAILFLTGDDVYNTAKGKMLQKNTKPDDYYGHGAILFYYDLDHDKYLNCKKECTDFSSPKNFPPEIVKAIKDGKMMAFGVSDEMQGLLTKPALAEYEKVEQSAWAEYEKVRQPAWAEYEKVEQSAWAEYKKVEQLAWAEYEKVRQPAWAEYEKVRQLAWAEYEKVRQPAWAEYKKVEQLALAEYEKVEQLALAEYEKVKQLAFWKLFNNPRKRTKAWR